MTFILEAAALDVKYVDIHHLRNGNYLTNIIDKLSEKIAQNSSKLMNNA